MRNRSLLITLFLLALTIILLAIEFYFRTIIDGVIESVSPEALIATINGALFVIILVIFIFTRKLLLLAKQERMLEIQELYINNLRELVKVIRIQRHDFVNHMQAIYALLKTDEIHTAQKYIEDLYQDIKITSEMLRVNIPEVSAMLLVKTGIAAAKGISFTVEADSDLRKLNIKPMDINTIVGNLIDNAFDAVAALKVSEKKVELRIFDTSKRWVFQVFNLGYIPQEIKDRIFTAGFSTKTGENRGLGLASVESVVKRNNGKIVVDSSQNRGTKFTVFFPKTD